MGLIRMIQTFWAMRKAQKQAKEAKQEIRNLKEKSESERLLDEQLREAAVTITQRIRELDKITKLREAQRKISDLEEATDRAYGEEEDDSEEDQETDDPADALVNELVKRVGSNVLNKIAPQAAPVVQQTLSNPDVKTRAHTLIDNTPLEQLTAIEEYAKSKGFI